METITLQGKIDFILFGNYEHILLVSEQGIVIDLNGRAYEIGLSFPKKKIQVNYWTADNYCSKDKMMQSILRCFYGEDIDVNYEDNGSMGSSLTGWMPNHQSELIFGGHDLMRELRDKDGKFMIIEFNIQD